MAWEGAERKALDAFVGALRSPNVRPVTVLSAPARPLYGDHWGISGVGMPRAGMDDSALFLPGRNILLISLTAVWCSTHGVSRICIGSLGGNPFPDAGPAFFHELARVLSRD